MAFIKKVKAERKAPVSKVPRKSIDFTLIRSLAGEAVRDMFGISKEKFNELALDGFSIALFDQPLALVVVKENSELASALFSRRENTKSKSHTFAAPEFIKTLVEQAIIPAERPEGFKANFTLTKLADESDEVVGIVEAADAEGFGNHIEAVYAIALTEITSFNRKPRVKADGLTDEGDGSTLQLNIFSKGGKGEGDEKDLVTPNSDIDELDDNDRS